MKKIEKFTREFSQFAKTDQVPAGKPIYSVGEKAKNLMILTQGSALVFRPAYPVRRYEASKIAFDVMRSNVNPVLGFEAWLQMPSYLDSVKALIACSILEVPRTQILRIRQDRPDLALQISDQAIAQMFQREQKLSDLRTKESTQLLASTLLSLSPDELITLDQGDIAGLIGYSREQVNRMIADLKRRGVMTTKGKLWKQVNDREYLANI